MIYHATRLAPLTFLACSHTFCLQAIRRKTYTDFIELYTAMASWSYYDMPQPQKVIELMPSTFARLLACRDEAKHPDEALYIKHVEEYLKLYSLFAYLLCFNNKEPPYAVDFCILRANLKDNFQWMQKTPGNICVIDSFCVPANSYVVVYMQMNFHMSIYQAPPIWPNKQRVFQGHPQLISTLQHSLSSKKKPHQDVLLKAESRLVYLCHCHVICM
jgi:hypothetical protein